MKIKSNLWPKIFVYTTLGVYFYVFMEWIFFITKTSFMSAMNLLQQIRVFLLSSLIFIVPVVLFLAILFFLSYYIQIRTVKKILNRVATLTPTLILALLSLILTDNFTYTVFGFGIVSTEGWKRVIYAILFIFFVLLFYKEIWGGNLFMNLKKQRLPKITIYAALLLVVLSVFFYMMGSPWSATTADAKLQATDTNGNEELPNIILLSTDGLNSSHMSVYGYQRETTPNIENYAQSALIFQNAFASTGNTGGTITSLLTGKSSITTRMYYPPDILIGTDSYQHLPGLLKQIGYKTVQLTDPYHADAYTRNLLNGFDVANSRSEEKSLISTVSQYVGDGGSTYFNTLIVERFMDRLQHAFFISTMVNPYKVVTEPAVRLSEQERLDTMLNFLAESNQPLFIQVHMLGTHGPRFEPPIRKFSNGQSQEADWMIDFYDDAILSFDHDVDYVFQRLAQIGKLDNSIIIVFSDHGMKWKSNVRVPLLIWFPDSEYTGIVHQNVQLLDIAPTILDYLDLVQPEWLEGDSLLEEIPQRYLFSTNPADSVKVKMNDGFYEGRMIPPFYQLGIVTMIACDNWYSLNLKEPKLTSGTVDGSTLSCNENTVPSEDDAVSIILGQLQKNNYDISTFPNSVPK